MMSESSRSRDVCRTPQALCKAGRRRSGAQPRPASKTTVYAVYRCTEGAHSFAVREWRLDAFGRTVQGRHSSHHTLSGARLAIPRGFENVGLADGEHPDIVEVWACPVA
jgi:hypothetical protein